jgi:hypothetical protein
VAAALALLDETDVLEAILEVNLPDGEMTPDLGGTLTLGSALWVA